MQNDRGLIIDSVAEGSLSEISGFRPGDAILSINSQKVSDMIDFLFHSAEETLSIEVERGGKTLSLSMEGAGARESGLSFKPFKIQTCRNNCIFCFVKQLPKGLRKTLYVKDEDYRMSFLYGNYITLANLKQEDKDRIVEQRLSPLYVSVHSTSGPLRNKMIGNAKAPDILKDLKFLADNKIRFNAQVVLCPGYNDGKELQKTISSLYKSYPYLLSIAVVPVGLTMYRKNHISPLTKSDAEAALDIIESFQKRYMKKHGNMLVYGADELYLKAGRTLPPLKTYGELHQIENGIGMLPLFLHQARKLKVSAAAEREKPYLTFTGVSFYPFLKKVAGRLAEKENIRLDVLEVENRFFGPLITVAGLLTGRDVIKAVLGSIDGHKALLVPDVVLNVEDKFLDDITLRDVQEAVGIPVRKIESSPEGLVKGMADAAA